MVKSLSIAELRDFIKHTLDQMLIYTQHAQAASHHQKKSSLNDNKNNNTAPPRDQNTLTFQYNERIERVPDAIYTLAVSLETAIHQKIKDLSEQSRILNLSEKYQDTVAESLAGIEHVMRNSPTVLDILKYHEDHETPTDQRLHDYYTNTLVPLLNLLLKLDNDLTSFHPKSEFKP